MSAVPFTLDAKSAEVTRELEDGSLIVGGYGLVYDEIDFEDEHFLEHVGGRLLDGLEDFLKGPAPLLHSHKPDQVLGRVLSAEHHPGKGIYVKALLDPQPKWSPLRSIWEAARRGRLGYSVGGKFDRKMTPRGPAIDRVRVVEWSLSSVPIGGRHTAVSVLAAKSLHVAEGKALTSRGDVIDAAEDHELAALRARVDQLTLGVIETRLRQMTDRIGGAT
jgi:hypothetical protein